MNNIAGMVAGNLYDKLVKPKNLKAFLILWLAVFVISQLVVFFWILPGKINTSAPFVDSLNSLFNCQECNIIGIWTMIITTIALLLLTFKVFVYILAVLVLCAGILLILIIPDDWLELADLFVLLFTIASPFIIFGLVVIELVPFYLK